MINIKYGVVDNVRLFIDDHSCLVLNVDMRGTNNSWYVTFGNISLGHRLEQFDNGRYQPGKPTNYAGYYIAKVMNVFDVNSLDVIKGRPVRIIFNDNLCIGIQNFLDFKRYFIPREDFLSDDEKNAYDFSVIFD